MQQKMNDSEKIAEYYELYEQRLYRVAYSILGNVWQAEEAVQETFVRVIKHRHDIFRMSDKRRTAYILKITKGISIDMYRANKRQPASYDTFGTGDSEDGSTGVSLSENIQKDEDSERVFEQIENRQLVGKLMEMLSADDGTVLRLRAIQQLGNRETAAIMCISETAVRKKYERALKKARKLLGKEMIVYGEQR